MERRQTPGNRYAMLFCRNFYAIISAAFFCVPIHPAASNEKIIIESISVNPNDDVVIKFDKQGDYTIERITVFYFTSLDPLDQYPQPFHIDPPFENNEFDIEFENIDSQLHFRIEAEKVGGGTLIGDEIHSTIYLEDNIGQMVGRIQMHWMNYAVYPFPNLVIPKPLPFDKVQVWFYSYDQHGDLQDPDLLIQFPQEFWDSNKIIDFDVASGKYAFQIKSVGTNGPTATSNIVDVEFDEPEVPTQINLSKVDIDTENNQINIHALVDNDGSDLFEYRLFRSEDLSYFTEVGRFWYDRNVFVLTDTVDLDVQSHPYYYYVELDLTELRSDTVSSLFLQALPKPYAGQDLQIRLEWKHPSPPEGSFEYKLFRQLPADQNLDYLMDCHTGNCIDDIPADQLGGDILYQLRALNDSDTIHSNLAMVSLEPFGEMPNAFRPASGVPENTEFLPNILLPPIEYLFEVYNRHGIRMFSSTDHLQAWTGDFQGQEAPEGAYYYRVRFTDISGDKHDLRGVVYLIR